MLRLDIERLVLDLGGPRKTAEAAKVPRTAPYRWIRNRHVSSQVLERLKEARPDIDIDAYFYEVACDADEPGSRTGVSGSRMVGNPDQAGG